MKSMQMDNEKELLQQQPQLPSDAAPPPWPSPQAPLPPQQSGGAQELPLPSPPKEVGGYKQEEVMVSNNTVIEIGGVMANDRGKTIMGSMQMDKNQLFQ